MKKITLSIIAAFALACAFTATNTATANQSAVEVSATNSEYKYLREVKVITSKGFWGKASLYKGVNTCDAYYVKGHNQYYAVRENKGTTMSEYGHYYYDSDGTAWYLNF